MSDRSSRSPWLTERTALAGLALVSVALAALVVLPYLQYVLLAVVLAYVLAPLQARLAPLVGRTTAALALVVAAVLTILLPLVYVLALAIAEGIELVAAIQEGDLDVAAVEARLARDGVEVDLGTTWETYREPIQTGVQGVASGAIDVVGGLPNVLIGLTVTTFVLFALLRDGPALVAWTESLLPVRRAVTREFLTQLDRLMWASVVGNAVVAGIQAVAVGVILVLLGVPAATFLTVATFLAALLPLVGAFAVWFPAAVYLFLIGDVVGAVVLLVYGSIVSASDNYLRPMLIGRGSELGAATVVVGIFGGVAVFGVVGLFIGPVVLGGAKVALDLWARERQGARVDWQVP